jgi:hypothetical protein
VRLNSMRTTSQPRSYNLCLLLISALYVLAAVLQERLLFNWDTSWLMHATEKLLAGGNYANDFFELNPPLILYLYTPAVLLNQWFGLPAYIGLQIYVFVLASISLYLCDHFASRIFRNDFVTHVFLITAACVFLILPLYDFGQRENLLVIFTLPYFLLVSYRLENPSTRTRLAWLIGLFASLGFAIKPYFLLTPFLIEIFYFYQTRRIFSFIRAETLAIFIFVLCYMLFIYLFHYDYLAVVLPYVSHTYYLGIAFSWTPIFLSPTLLFCLIPIVLHGIFYKKNPYKTVCNILLIAMISFLLSYLLQRTTWHDHILPAYSLAVLSTILWLLSVKPEKNHPLLFLVFAILLLNFPLYNSITVYQSTVKLKQNFSALIQFLQQHAKHQYVYFFCNTIYGEYPAIDYADALPSSRISDLNWLVPIENHNNLTAATRARDKNYMTSLMIADLNKYKPAYIFVDVSPTKKYFNNTDFDYIKFFSQHPEFVAIWKSYSYVSRVEIPGVFRFDVYKRG